MDIAAGGWEGTFFPSPPFPLPIPHKKTWGIHCNHKKFFLSKKIFPRPLHWYHYSYRRVSLWFLVELVEIYQMSDTYIWVISIPYTLKLLVYSFDGHSRWRVGGGYPPYPHLPPSPVKRNGEFIATIQNVSEVKQFSYGYNTGILIVFDGFLCCSW